MSFWPLGNRVSATIGQGIIGPGGRPQLEGKVLPILQQIPGWMFHPWLAEIRAPVGSQEVVGHTHECLLLIG